MSSIKAFAFQFDRVVIETCMTINELSLHLTSVTLQAAGDVFGLGDAQDLLSRR